MDFLVGTWALRREGESVGREFGVDVETVGAWLEVRGMGTQRMGGVSPTASVPEEIGDSLQFSVANGGEYGLLQRLLPGLFKLDVSHSI